MKKICILLEEKWHTESLPDAAEAVRAYRGYGFDTDLQIMDELDKVTLEPSGAEQLAEEPSGAEQLAEEPSGTKQFAVEPTNAVQSASDRSQAKASLNAAQILTSQDPDTLYIADSARLLSQLEGIGAAFCAYAHSCNTGEDLKAAEYILMEPQWVDRDSLVKIWQRQRNIPWTILETDRCIVREFVPEDLDAVYELYDAEARRFLEPPSENRSREKDILTSYINRVYRLCGYGHWAVICKETGELIGRMGFSFPPSPEQESPDPKPDAVFGYLVRSDWRGRGITREVGAAILQYGFEKLGFEAIGADAAVSNTISDKILRKFSFIPVAEDKNQRYYILHEHNWNQCPARGTPSSRE